MYYFEIDLETNIVIGVGNSTERFEREGFIECDEQTYLSNIMGKKWNGKTFEEIEVEAKEEPKYVSLEDLDKKLDKIIELLNVKKD